MRIPLWFHLLWQKIRGGIGLSPNALCRGVDVSEFNGEVDFQALRSKHGIKFAILRCGYGSNYADQDDACFFQNVRACNEAGLPYGVYLYAYAQNEAMAKSEADHVIRLIKGTDPAYGVWYDVEDKSILSIGNLADICKTWCDAVLDAGITCVGIYASSSVMNNKQQLASPKLDKYEKWVADWSLTCDYPNPGIWQFTDTAELNGRIFDMDYAYKNYPDITGADMTPDKFNEMMNAYLEALQKKPVDSWAADAWEAAVEAGIFDGKGPRSPLTREQAAIVIERLQKK